MTGTDELLTIRQVAELLGIQRQTVYQAISAGRLPATTVLERVAVRRSDAEEYKQRTQEIGPEGGRPRKPRRQPGRPRKDRKEAPT